MAKKRIISVTNWDKWQARSDKEMPWLKLWGRLFKEPWFQELSESERFATVAFLDLSRHFKNEIDVKLLQNGYFGRVYGLFSFTPSSVLKLCNSLCGIGFLSDNCRTKVRHIKSRKDKEEDKKENSRTNVRQPAEDFIQDLKNNTAYKHINIDQELGKMDAWIKVHPGRQKTKKFVVNWINKIEAPLVAHKITKVPVPNRECEACNGSGRLVDGVKCWCFK